MAAVVVSPVLILERIRYARRVYRGMKFPRHTRTQGGRGCVSRKGIGGIGGGVYQGMKFPIL